MRNSPVLEDIELINGDLTVRKATMRDIPAVLHLINSYAAEGIMLPRTEFEISAKTFAISRLSMPVRVCSDAAPCIFTRPTSGEIRSLAVAPEAKGQGVGVLLTKTLEKEAINNDLHTIFAFTYVDQFFQ